MRELPVAGHGLVGGELPVAVGALLGPVVAVHPHVLLQVAGRVGLAANVAHGGLEVGRPGVIQTVDLQSPGRFFSGVPRIQELLYLQGRFQFFKTLHKDAEADSASLSRKFPPGGKY